MNFKIIPALVCLTTGTVLSLSSSAYAVTFTKSVGVNRGGVTTEGAFTNQPNATTIDFNTVTLTNGGFSSGIATYSGISGTSKIVADQYAPKDPTGTANTSRYLAVFQANPVTINFTTPLSYFGIDLGSVDPTTDQLQFFNGATLLTTFTGASLGIANQGSAYVDFFANNTANPAFDRIVITKTGTGGFETDNHAYTVVPEPLTILGSGMALGFGALLKRQQSRKRHRTEQIG